MSVSRWIWIVLALSISTAVYLTIRYGLRPKPIPVLNPTSFSELRQIGVVLYKRLHQNIRTERIVLLGSSDDIQNYDQVWLGLAESARADKEKLVIFAREGLKVAPVDGAEVVTFGDEQVASGSLFEEISQRKMRKQLVVVHGWTGEITHLVRGSLSQKLDRVVKHPVLSISMLRFAIGEADVNELQPHCLDVSPDADDFKQVACASFKVARKFLKKRLAADRIWAVAERHGLKEYLLFIHLP